MLSSPTFLGCTEEGEMERHRNLRSRRKRRNDQPVVKTKQTELNKDINCMPMGFWSVQPEGRKSYFIPAETLPQKIDVQT